MEWMEMRKMEYSRAMRLDLISKAKGVSAAEHYMKNLPSAEQNRNTYGALLNSYCAEAAEQEALDIFAEMIQLGFVTTSLPFDNLMTMFLKLRRYDTIPSLARQMRDMNIFFSTYSYNLLMKAFAGMNDIEAVERVLERIHLTDSQRIDWTTYSNLASIYAHAGLFNKAKLSLAKIEDIMKRTARTREMYHFLLRLYGSITEPNCVFRVWNVLNETHPGFNNTSYLALLQALDKLNDIEGLRASFREWLDHHSSYDVRLAHVFVGALLRNNLYDEALLAFEDAAKRTSGPFLKMREIFMLYFLRISRPDLALGYLEANANEARFLRREDKVVNAFLDYFESSRDVDGVERAFETMKRIYPPNSDDYQKLMRIYIAAEKLAPEMRSRLEREGVEISPEHEDLLRKVCPE